MSTEPHIADAEDGFIVLAVTPDMRGGSIALNSFIPKDS